MRTLFIDRDPVTFRDISLHLQGARVNDFGHAVLLLILQTLGYYVQPRDSTHFVKLFADSQFYSCKAFFIYQRNQVANGKSTTPYIAAF